MNEKGSTQAIIVALLVLLILGGIAFYLLPQKDKLTPTYSGTPNLNP